MSETRLPLAGAGRGTGAGAGTGTGTGAGTGTGTGTGDPGPQPRVVEASSLRLVGTLGVAGSLAGLAIVLVFEWANPRIEAWRAEVLATAVTEVLADADRYETAYLDAGAFTLTPAADTSDLDRVYVGYDRSGTRVGVALVGAGTGFQDVIRLIFGYDPESRNVVGMQVLESKETPGLGDKIQNDSAFVSEFESVAVPLLALKAGRERGADSEVTMITGATISSRAIVDIINARLDEVGALVDDFWAASTVSAPTGEALARPSGGPS